MLKQQYNKLNNKYLNTNIETLNNPYYFCLFAPPTYYNSSVKRHIGLLYQSNVNHNQDLLYCPKVSQSSLLNQVDRTLIYVYVNSPEIIENNIFESTENEGLRDEVNVEVKPQVNLTNKINEKSPVVSNPIDDNWDIVVKKPNFWNFKANFSLQFMQNYFTDNWYKGGENNNSWKGEMNIEANYNNKQKIIFDNRLEMRLGFQSSHGDEKHKYRSNSDLIRLTNKFGLQATKRWYYTLTLQSWTQFYPGYKKNDPKVYSDFMSPFESLLTIGMDYKLNIKNFNISASLSPLASKFKYVDRSAIAPSFGINDGGKTNFDYGSNITSNYTWAICKNISWKGRIYYFTDYSNSQIEWENTFNLKINKFLSTKLFVYPRFDDSVNKKDSHSYFQLNETLSIGFDYTF